MKKRCDIVIPVWNQLAMTRDCINSIMRNTQYPFRLIIVDNSSDVPAQSYFKSLNELHGDRVVIIRNTNNIGFVKAVNQGMQFSDAEYVCILNNDTVVSNGWLSEMIDILEANKDIGIINPSSNTSGQFPNGLEIERYAETLRPLRGKYQELYAGRAFAMVVKREVIKRIGYLDEIYGMGYFDDTDYCKRAQACGYKVVRAKASYVYHKESQSFSKIQERKDIFLENENRFISRWGRCLRVAYLIRRPRQKNDLSRTSSNINRFARKGHQVWIFTNHGLASRLNLIDHDGIRFLYCPQILFSMVVLYKIFRRKQKKKLHVILTDNRIIYKLFKFFGKMLGAPVFMDDDFSNIEQRLTEMSQSGLYDTDVARV